MLGMPPVLMNMNRRTSFAHVMHEVAVIRAHQNADDADSVLSALKFVAETSTNTARALQDLNACMLRLTGALVTSNPNHAASLPEVTQMQNQVNFPSPVPPPAPPAPHGPPCSPRPWPDPAQAMALTGPGHGLAWPGLALAMAWPEPVSPPQPSHPCTTLTLRDPQYIIHNTIHNTINTYNT
jgi:hypothetical protein